MKTKFSIIILTLLTNLSGFTQKPDKYLIKSRMLADKYQYLEAQEAISSSVTQNCIDYPVTQGMIAYGLKDYNKAIQLFQQASDLHSGDYLLEISKCYAKLNLTEKAISFLNSYLKTKNKLPISKIVNDSAFQKIRNSPSWEKLWANAEYSDQELKVNQIKSLAEVEMNNRFSTSLDEALNKYSYNSELLLLQSRYFEGNGLYEAALKSINQALLHKTVNNDALYFQKSNIEFKMGDLKQSLTSINEAINQNAFQLDYYLKRITINRLLKDFVKAADDIQLLEFCIPNDPELLYAKAIQDADGEDYLKAYQNLNALIQKDQSNPDYFVLRGQLGLKTKQFSKADEDFGMALDLDPNKTEANLGKGLTRYNLNDTESACIYWQKAANEGNRDAKNYIIKYCK